ncbi:MAG: hypothetical protein EBY43_01625, partial [Opitutae bacterium]|nr:hypothetical protein [Opitutae bacterium]
NYFIYVVLLLIGLWAMIAKNNFIKKLIGMSIFQTAIILFYVSIGVKEGATIPIYLPEHDPHGTPVLADSNSSETILAMPQALDASLVPSYTNPLPHVLMLTAIVVGVATLGLALSICLRIYRAYGTVEEDELLIKLEEEDSRNSGLPRRRRPRRRNPKPSNQNIQGSSLESNISEKPKRRKSSNSQKSMGRLATSRTKPSLKDTQSGTKKPVRRKRTNQSKEGNSQ